MKQFIETLEIKIIIVENEIKLGNDKIIPMKNNEYL